MKKIALLCSCLGLSLLANNAGAAVDYWDPQGTTGANPHTGDMTGTWESTLWSTTSAGVSSTTAWAEGAAAAFSVHSGTGTPAFVVTMNANHTIAGFFNGGILLGNTACPVTISGTGIMTMASANLNGFAAFNGTGGTDPATITINNVIAGPTTGGICLEETGQIFLNGINTFAGGTYVGYSGASFISTAVGHYNNSASFGTAPIYLLNAQGGSLAIEGSSAITIPNQFINYNAAAQSIDLTGLPSPNGPIFSGPWVMSGGGGGTGGGTYTTTAVLATYGPVSIGSGGAAANVVTISGVISGTNALTKYDVGILALSGANTFSGPLTINNGTLQLTSSGSINNCSQIFISTNGLSAGGTFDVSAYSTYTLSSGTLLKANGVGGGGYGADVPATINGQLGGTVSLGSQPIYLTFSGSPSGDLQDFPLWISQGTLALNNNTITVNNATGTPLTSGYYDLIHVGDGFTGVVTGTLPGSVNVLGSGLAAGCVATVQIGNGLFSSDVTMFVSASAATTPTTTAITLPASVPSGTAPVLVATVNPDPSASPGNTVQFYVNGVALGTPVTVVSGGTATADTTSLTTLGPGNYAINAVYSGSSDNVYQSSSAPTVTLQVTTASTQYIVYWDNNGTSTPGSGTWDTTTPNWALTSALTASTVASPSSGYVIFAAGTTAIPTLNIAVNSAVSCAGMQDLTSGAIVTNLNFSGTGSIGIADNALQPFHCGPGTATLTFNVPLTGTGGIMQLDSGSLALYGNNTYAGGTEVTGLQVIFYNNNNSFGTGPITVGGSGNALVSSAGAALVITNNFSFPTANFNINLAGGNPVAGAPGTTFSGNFSLPATGTNTINTSSTATEVTEISGVINGASALNVADDGTLELGGVNTYTGNTLITSPATLKIVGSGSLKSGSYPGAIVNGGTFNYNSTANQTLSGVISGAGALIHNGTGTLTLSGANTYTGKTTINNGSLVIKQDNNLGAAPGSVVANQLTLNNNVNNGANNYGLRDTGGTFSLSANRGITLGANGGSINVQNGFTLTIPGIIAGTGPFYASPNSSAGYGTIVLSGLNTYSGATIIGAGTLQLGVNGALPSGTPLTIGSSALSAAGGSFFNMNGKSQTIGSLTSSTGIGAPGTGTPTVQLTGALTINETTPSTFAGVITGSGGTLTKMGGSTLTLSGVNNYTGLTSISAGTLELSGSIAGNVNNSGGVLKLDGATSLASSATVTLAASPAAGAVNLNFIGTQTVSALFYGGVQKTAGTWGGTGSGASNIDPAFIGTGVLNVTTGGASPPYSVSSASVDPTGTTMSMTWSSASGFTYHVVHGTAATPKSTWATVPGTTVTATGSSTSISFPISGYGQEQLFTVVSP